MTGTLGITKRKNKDIERKSLISTDIFVRKQLPELLWLIMPKIWKQHEASRGFSATVTCCVTLFQCRLLMTGRRDEQETIIVQAGVSTDIVFRSNGVFFGAGGAGTAIGTKRAVIRSATVITDSSHLMPVIKRMFNSEIYMYFESEK